MTNNWADIGNATLIVVMGANPVENHPACAAHMNRARFPKDFFANTDPRYNKKEANLIVIDPRKTRTALQVDATRPGDKYVRIRPGTDIAFINGLVRYIIDEMESRDVADPQRVAFFNYLNKNNAGTFYADDNSGATKAVAMGDAGGSSVYSDARFIVNGTGTDYERVQIDWASGNINDPAIAPDATTISNFPKKAATVDADANTVYNRLKAHVAHYDTTTVADICGCSEADLVFVANAYIENSRCSSTGAAHVLGGGEDPRDPNYRATTMLYAMGLTQHTYGSQNVKSFAVLQVLMGNMGRAGGGINALRGIHNVQGSTDMGLLYHLIPGYSGNPTVQPTAYPDTTTNAFGKYMDGLWGNPVSGTGTRTSMNSSYDDAYNTAAMGLQQRGFYNMTRAFFGDQVAAPSRAQVDSLYALWPKTNGSNHVRMFREMASGLTKAAVVWGQNPAVTEPNQGAVRAGLKEVDLLVVADMFETETASCDRKVGGVTYLLPAASHVEKAGSVTNSGRVLQWRQQATDPKGNSKDDMEMILRLAYALDGAGAFSHIKAVWDGTTYAGVTHPGYDTSVYKQLYANQYGYNAATDTYADVTGNAEVAYPLGSTVDASPTYTTTAVYGSEWVHELAYRQMSAGVGSGGCLWIYTNGYYTTLDKTNLNTNYSAWQVANRAKSRGREDVFGTFGFHKWGYSWLVNRRVLYNNGEIPGDIADYFMGPDSAARLFVSTATIVLNYSRWYRKVHNMSDTPRLPDHTVPAVHVLPGRFPSHTEPYETPREDLVAIYGKNSSTGTDKGTYVANQYMNLLTAGTNVGSVATYPYVLTSIRCVEHFQGGPITRNNHWNVEAEPQPWIELNSADAFAEDIKDGDLVRIVTARNDGYVNDEIESTYPRALQGEGFIARVGAGTQASQRVASGVVAIPWHWGDRGLSTGCRANDLCIDAGDANTYIPEYKACLCRIEKM